MVSTAVIALLALYLPGAFAQRDDDYAFVRTLVDIHRQVSVNYVDPVDQTKLRDGALQGMLSTLDPYTVYVPPADQKAFDESMDGSFEGVGIQLNQLDNGEIEVATPVDGSPAHKAGVQAGDVLLKVNGQVIGKTKIEDLTPKVRGPAGSTVTLTLRHLTGEVVDLSMQRMQYILPTIKGFDRNADNTWNYWTNHGDAKAPKIAYVRITQFTGDTFPTLDPVLHQLARDGMQGLIIDLRNNPGGLLDQAERVANLFLPKGATIVSTKGRNRPESKTLANGENALPEFPIAVIVNERSASASEVLAGALSDNKRAVIVGTRSFGKGSVQEVVHLDGNAGELKITVAHYYLPSGRCVHRLKDATIWGVDPQIPVPVDEATEIAVWDARLDTENFRRPVVATPPKPATTPTSQPAPAPKDTQLEQAVTTLNAVIVLGDRAEKK